MIKKTLYFGSFVKLKTKLSQLVIINGSKDYRTIPIEDIGIVILDHYSIEINQYTLNALIENNVCIVITNNKHIPSGFLLSLANNKLQGKIIREQLNASKPLNKSLWKQVVVKKITNQLGNLKRMNLPYKYMVRLKTKVKSGDPENIEAQASRYYWSELFNEIEFKRDRFGTGPNILLNYGYTILRAVIARSLIGSGLLPIIGIHHHNKYNAYPLADDIMEPFRPFVDKIVKNIFEENKEIDSLNIEIKRKLLEIPNLPVKLKGENYPLMVAASRTSASLSKCFSGDSKNLVYPKCG